MKESEIEESFLGSFELCENKGEVAYAVRWHYIISCGNIAIIIIKIRWGGAVQSS